MHLGLAASAEVVHAPIDALDEISAQAPAFTARTTDWRNRAVLGEDRALHLLEETDAAGYAVSCIVRALPSRTTVDPELVEHMCVCTAAAPSKSGPAGAPEQIVS